MSPLISAQISTRPIGSRKSADVNEVEIGVAAKILIAGEELQPHRAEIRVRGFPSDWSKRLVQNRDSCKPGVLVCNCARTEDANAHLYILGCVKKEYGNFVPYSFDFAEKCSYRPSAAYWPPRVVCTLGVAR